MTVNAIAGASVALTALNSSSSSGASASSSAGETTTVSTAPDGTVTRTVTAADGKIVSVTVTKPAAAQKADTTGNTANGNALLDVQA